MLGKCTSLRMMSDCELTFQTERRKNNGFLYSTYPGNHHDFSLKGYKGGKVAHGDQRRVADR
jgi:hypothetical protein